MPTQHQRDLNRLASARYRARHPERRFKTCAAYRGTEHGKQVDREGQWRRRGVRLQKEYGINQATYDKMLAEQEGKCYLCNQPETMTQGGKVVQLCVDHSHKTGQVRRLLCHGCNFLVGRVEARPALHEKALAYVRQFGD